MSTATDDEKIKKRLAGIKHTVLVLSGKGGVGKSTVAVNIAVALAAAGKQVGLLDVDVHGPSVPNLLGVAGLPLHGTQEAIHPFEIGENLKVMSIGFMLRNTDDAVIWRGPMKYNVIKQFLGDVEWGELDFLVIDSPPGTGDEPLSVAQLVTGADGAVIVTTPQSIALIDVRKCITFCNQLSMPVLGVVENMSGFICPKCGEKTDIFKTGGGEEMARDMGVPFLGRVPVDPDIVAASDDGRPYVVNFPHTDAGKIFAAIAAPILALDSEGGDLPAAANVAAKVTERAADAAGKEAAMAPANPENSANEEKSNQPKGGTMKIAIPVSGGRLCMHFGHCEEFALVEVDWEKKEIRGSEMLQAPPHEPGRLPVWLNERGASLVIAGGMGQRAQAIFRDKAVDVIVGAPAEEPEAVVRAYLDGNLVTGSNICDH
jgi:Mrp family chromosome partitioning ATPase/predicted Fe-Mo cluster-binding NifX family protein